MLVVDVLKTIVSGRGKNVIEVKKGANFSVKSLEVVHQKANLTSDDRLEKSEFAV